MMVEVSNFNFNFTKKFYGKLYYCCIKKYKHGAKEIVLDLRCCLALSLTQLDPRFNNDTQEMLNKPQALLDVASILPPPPNMNIF